MSRQRTIMLVLFAAIASLGTTSSTDCNSDLELIGLANNEMSTTLSVSANPVNLGDYVTITATVDPGSRMVQKYSWSVDGQLVTETETQATTDTIVYPFTSAGRHEVEVVVIAYKSDYAFDGDPFTFATMTDAAMVYIDVTVPTLTVQVTLDRSSINQGESVTATATATASGGQPPYATYFWADPDDSAWVQGDATHTDAIHATGTGTVCCIVRDSRSIDSEPGCASVTVVENDQPADDNPPTSTYNSPAGTWSTTWNTMVLTVSGNAVSGTYDFHGGTISGTLSGNTVSGTWSEPESTPGKDTGPFAFDFASDWMSFTGWWQYTNSSGGGNWSGTRVTN